MSPPGGPKGHEGFDETYWRENYGELADMDGIGNAEAHARYLRASFDVVLQPVRSVADFGFGMGRVFEAVLAAFEPFKALGIEPSPVVYDNAASRTLCGEKTNLALERTDLLTWCRKPDHARLRFDLGVCTSVWQYLDDASLEEVVPVLARRVRWLYLTVPTAEELEQQRADGFHDRYAIGRPRRWYIDLLAPHFTRVGARLVESRERVEEAESPFTDQLFRDWKP